MKLGAALALLLALVSCRPAATTMGTGAAPHTLRIGYLNDPSSLNPLFAFAQIQIDLCDLFAETLVGLNSRNQLVGLLATQVPSRQNGGISADGRTITYHLRRDAVFADGIPLTAKDVIFTYRAILDPRNPVTEAEPYRRIARITAPDAHTVVLTLRRPWAAAPAELFAQSDFSYGILPSHAFGDDPGNVAHGSWNDAPFGTGPFRVLRWERGNRIVLVPNPHAWRKPKLQSLVFKIFPDDSARLIALRTHDIDVADLQGEKVLEARRAAAIHVVTTPVNEELFIAFQTQRKPLDDPRVRRALAQAIDTRRILRDALYGLYEPDTTEQPSMMWAFDSQIPAWRFDPDAASRALDAAGYVRHDGARFTVDIGFVGTQAYWRRIAALVQSDLRQIGIDAQLNGYTETVFEGGGATDVMHSGKADILLTGFFNGSDPEEAELFTCNNRAPAGNDPARFCSAAYDREYAVQQRTLDRSARRKAFFAMQQELHDSAAIDFLFTGAYFDGVADYVSGWTPNMLYRYSQAERWDVILKR